MRGALKVLFVPVMLLGFNGAAVWIVMAHLSLYWLAPLLLVAIAFATAVERVIPISTPGIVARASCVATSPMPWSIWPSSSS